MRLCLGLGFLTACSILPSRGFAHEPSEPNHEEITVTVAGKPHEPVVASTSTVTAREFSAVPRRAAEDALRLVPGVLLIQHGSEGKGYQFLVRGFDAAHGSDFEVTVDGIPINEWSNVHAQGYLDLGFVIPELVSTVRVTKGPFTLGQGAFAMAGSAAYHLGVEPEDRGVRMAYTIGTTNRHRALVTYSPRGGSGHDFIASEAVHDEGFGSRRGVTKGTLLAKTELARSERFGVLSLLAGGSIARFELPGALRADDYEAGRIGFFESYTEKSRGASMRSILGFTYEKDGPESELRVITHGGLRRLEVFENFTGYLFDAEQGDYRAQYQDALNLGLKATLTQQILPSLHANLGAGVAVDILEQEQWHTNSMEQRLDQERGLHATQALSHALAGLTWRPLTTLRLDAGARLDVAHVQVSDNLAPGGQGQGLEPAISPRAVFEWQPLDPIQLFAAYGRGFRPPEARAFTPYAPGQLGLSDDLYAGGEPAMTMSDAFELGTRYRANQNISAELSGFATFVARESVYDHVSGVNLELNATRRVGAELALRGTVGDFLLLTADATLVDARFVESGRPVPMAPTLFGSARAMFGRELGARAGLRFLAVAPRPLAHGAMSSTLTRLDLTAGYHWPVWRLDLEIENLLAQSIREGEYHYASDWQRSEPPSSLPALHFVAGPPFNARLTLTAVF